MLIDNVISLTFGELQNTPNVRDCYEIAFNSSEVRRGDLFIVNNQESVTEAIANGAYALLYDCDVVISDSEIAWIKVDDIDAAVTKILRHQLLEANIEIFTFNSISITMTQALSQDSRLHVLNTNSLEQIYKVIKNLSSNSILIIDEALSATTIFPTCNFYESINTDTVTLLESSLFQSSFLYQERYYEQQRISPLLLPYFQTALDFFKAKNLEYSISKMTPLNHFEPIFLNRSLVIKDYGSTENVVILESNKALFYEAIDFLKKKASWSSILILSPENIDIIKYDNIKYKTFCTSTDIITLLRETAYNFTLILHDKSLKECFNDAKQTQQLTFAL